MLPDDLLENLDCQWPDTLAVYAGNLNLRRGEFAGEDLKTLETLHAYALEKRLAMKARTAGDVTQALRREAHCEALYNSLPPYAKW